MVAPLHPLARPERAAARVTRARAALQHCKLCAHHCGVDRSRVPAGKCHCGPEGRIFSAQVEVADELSLIPTFAIAFAGCDLRCAFCVTGRQSWNGRAGNSVDFSALAQTAARALASGAQTIMILGGEPTVHLPSVLELVAQLPNHARLVWKTNAHQSALSRELLHGLFEVWLADLKFGNDACAERLSRTPDYLAVTRANLCWAADQAELIVRHLIMPGHVDCCWAPTARWLAGTLPQAQVSLRHGYWPGWHSHRHAELNRLVTSAEAARAEAIARDFALPLAA